MSVHTRVAFSTASVERPSQPVGRQASLMWSIVFVSLVVAATVPGGHLPLAIYALSFWHYYLYWLAYCLAAVSLGAFKRDALLMKTVSLVGLGVAYLAAPLNLPSVALVVAGFLLNGAAARALGVDRTYYGHEVAGLPWRQVTAFPYTAISHPMLVGNIAAFGGMLLNADFRREWLPLGLGHVIMNVGLLFMELAIRPRPRDADPPVGRDEAMLPVTIQVGFRLVPPGMAVGALLGWAAGSWGPWPNHAPVAAAVGGFTFGYAVLTYLCYSLPAPRSHGRHEAVWNMIND